MKKLRFSILAIISFLFAGIQLVGQPLCNMVHYSSKDGLSENTVMSILQDKKGYMWFGTWDGLCRFDGYTFTTFKARPGDSIQMTNSRINKIAEDLNGFIWTLGYGKDVCRFNPKTETFQNVPHPDSLYGRSEFVGIHCLPKGIVWLLTENDGAIRVTTNNIDNNIKCQLFSVKNNLLEGNTISEVFEDREKNEWLLTDNGLTVLKEGEKKPMVFFFENEEMASAKRQSFFCNLERVHDIWFGSVQGRVWRYEKKGGRFTLLQIPTVSGIRSIHQMNDKQFFISTIADGFFVYNNITNLFQHFSAQQTPGMKSNVVLATYQTKNGDIWIQQDLDGITQYIPALQKVVSHQVPDNAWSSNYKPEFFISEDVNGYLWIHPNGGGFSYYDNKSGHLVPFNTDPSAPQLFFSKLLHSMYSDKQGNLWFCPRTKGIKKVTFPRNNFHLLLPFSDAQSITGNEVRAIMVDNQQNMWVASKEGKVAVYNSRNVLIGYLNNKGEIVKSNVDFGALVYCLSSDDKGNIWVGTKGDGLMKLTPKTNQSYNIEQFKYNEQDLYSLSNDQIYHIYIDSKNRIWMATFGGGLNLISKDKSGRTIFINHRNNLNGYPINTCYRARYITSDYNGNICVATTNGLITFSDDFVEPESIYFRHFNYGMGDSACISNNDVHYIHVTQNREVFLATFGGGLNEVVNQMGDSLLRFKYFSKDDGLTSDVLFAISEDQNKNLWISSENGLSRFSTTTQSIENYTKSDFGYDLTFSEAATVTDKHGNIYFGTNQGLLRFHPDSVRKSTFIPPIVFTELKLFNKIVSPEPGSPILKKHIDNLDGLVFKHNENIFSIGFAALDMKNPNKVQYAYMLDGFESNWNYVQNQRVANYTNLPHGSYVFKVKSTNGDGVWVENTRDLKIVVLPSFWVTPWAISIYTVVFLLVVFSIVYVLFTIYRLKHSVEIEAQLSELKLNFFTDISHELRTPLTLISGPIENVLKDKTISAEIRDQIKLVERNTTRMLRLINQILDFVKLKNNKMKMTVEEVNMVAFIRQVMDHFVTLALEKNIRFDLKCSTEEMVIWADTDKLEKIVFNLLSNAFKYTENDKQITIYLTEQDTEIVLVIKDTGVGISDNKKAVLFGRFENIWHRNLLNQPSTGIGLAVVKELVDLHQGTIAFESIEGVGSEFTIHLKKGLSHFNHDVEIIVSDATVHSSSTPTDVIRSVNEPMSGSPISILTDDHIPATTILLVEDHDDLRGFIVKLLSNRYKVVEARNGMEGLNKAIDLIPDLIISDLMMPVMDGTEMLQKVRNHIDISHIPFIILTAKTTLDSQLEGLDNGADAYITKPFSTSFLQAQVENLLHQRQKLHDFYQGIQQGSKLGVEPARPVIASLDKQFIDSLMMLMEDNMDNGALVVEDLVAKLAVSRSVFFKKLKTLTGLAPIEFIREIRLKRAAQLIEDSQYNMTQIAYMVGINDSRYFSKCFKQRFGVTPSQFKEQLEGDKPAS